MISKIIQHIFNYLFPPTCIICKEENTVINICKDCSQRLELSRETRRPWIFSLYRYKTEPVSLCVRHIKNFPDQALLHKIIQQNEFMIFGWAMGLLKNFNCNQIVIIPVPIHRSRFIDRGYNQAELIAEAFQKVIVENKRNISIPVYIETDLIVKSKKTDKQALVSEKSIRLKNIRGAFSIQKGRDAVHLGQSLVIIIDDVTTTGGTLDEIRTILLPYAKAVFAFTLAH